MNLLKKVRGVDGSSGWKHGIGIQMLSLKLIQWLNLSRAIYRGLTFYPHFQSMSIRSRDSLHSNSWSKGGMVVSFLGRHPAGVLGFCRGVKARGLDWFSRRVLVLIIVNWLFETFNFANLALQSFFNQKISLQNRNLLIKICILVQALFVFE